MQFDFDLFAKHITILQKLFLEGLDHASQKRFGKGIGFLSNEKATDGSWPKFHYSTAWITQSNHEKLLKDTWLANILATFESMDKALRSVPALNHPDIKWSIHFQKSAPTKRNANPLPGYRIEFMDARLTNGFVKTPTTAIKVLRQVLDDIGSMPTPAPARNFLINGQIWVATSPVDVARLYAALHNPGLLNPSRPQGPQVLPAIREMLDTSALIKELQAS
jgi:hypothetical protein